MDDRRKDSFIALLKSVTIVPVERGPASNVSESGELVAEPEVLIVDWNLRHPIFDATPTLQYSPQLHNLAKRLGPQEPYLAVHWRTETMAPDTLSPCAYALVEALEELLHEATSKNITSIWFASDYPRAIKRKEDGAEEASFTKSGTYKRLTAQLEAAINVLRESFSESGSLNDWKVRELLDVQRNELGDDEWLLDDIGARGILDKLISINAKKFISGSRACSRHRWVQFIALITNADEDPSSYTAQIIQARAAREEFEENIVDVFGR
ncbi:hypothetical protein BJ165DRAFT_1353420 [Panaeolus papilionaceus]|nr:hypothetical protein BJ165DRAFT_1353420 [Panaeolus papilionaceus]